MRNLAGFCFGELLPSSEEWKKRSAPADKWGNNIL